MTKELNRLYVNGRWQRPQGSRVIPLVNPATEQVIAEVTLGSPEDVDRAVAAARAAFDRGAAGERADRIALLERICDIYQRRAAELARAISDEMGAPITLARQGHVPAGLTHIRQALSVLRDYSFDEVVNATRLTREPIGVCALITPWNWPLNQIGCKVGPALAAGCAVVLKPSELAPLSATLFAEIVDEAGAPAGLFNLVHGDGPEVGEALSRHPDVDMVSFTGSTRAGILVAKAAADTVKRVTQELGGKSPSLILDDADLEAAVRHSATFCFRNSGQSCNAPTRLLVPLDRADEAAEIARDVAASVAVGDPRNEETWMGPVANGTQYGKVIELIEAGLREGARLVAGGTDRPSGCDRGYFVPATVFSDVKPDMRIAREEVFGPVLAILPYRDEAEAVAIANDTPYGLSAYISSADAERARRLARQIRAGMVHINGARGDPAAAFGGYKQSGNGREWGVLGFEEFLEVKSIFGYAATA
jgi:aldehyde dehydrogenase (NAD+)